MCVIMVVSKERPTEEMVERAWTANDDGFGVAWREREGDDVLVHWKKGIDKVEEAKELCATLPLPYIAHFRIASIGGVKKTLTHPFLVDKSASTALEGKTKGLVMFHNGHWQDWNKEAWNAMINSNNKPPAGDWSDSRAIAWMMSIYSPNLMEFLTTQRGAILGPKVLDVFTGPGWVKVNDVFCSNDHFWTSRGYRNTGSVTFRMCREAYCRDRVEPAKDYCLKHLYLEHKAGNSNSNHNQSDSKSDTEVEPGKKTQTSLVQIATGGTNRPFILTRAEVEQFRKDNVISKSMYKKFQKNFEDLASGGNRATRANKKLESLSDRATEMFVTGSRG